MSRLLDDPPATVKLAVDFYDQTERERLLRYPSAQQIRHVVQEGITVQLSEFLTYYMFHKKRPGKPGYRGYVELGAKIGHAAADLEDFVTMADGSLVNAPNSAPQDRAITERVGEAAALCVLGRIHDVHDADWDRVPEHRGRSGFPSFDFEYPFPTASDGTRIVQVEAKGTSVADASELSQNIRTHKGKIDKKKRDIKEREKAQTYPHPAELRYGVICALGTKGPLRCWLTDPSADAAIDPRRYRLLSRLQFMFDWISFLSGRSQFAASFATRLRALNELNNPFELAEAPLLRGNGEPYDLASTAFGSQPSLFAHLCRVSDGPAVGTLVPVPEGRLFFLGIQRHLFEKAASQDFESILKYRDPGGSVYKSVDCLIPRGRARTMGIESLHQGRDEVAPYVTFSAEGMLHYGQGGAVFGFVTPEGRSGEE